MKAAFIGLVLAIVLAAGGGIFFLNQQKATQQSNAEDASRTAQSEQTEENAIAGSIKEAIMAGNSYNCEFVDDAGRKTTSYIKNKSIRADIISSTPETSGSVLMKDKTIYFWNGAQGMKMVLNEDLFSMTGDSFAQSNNEQQEELMKSLEKYKDSCKQTVVDDNLFEQPKNVIFTDFATVTIPTANNNDNTVPTFYKTQVEEIMKQQSQEGSNQ